MARMDSYDAVMIEHRLRSEHADRMGWLRQAAAESKAPPRRPGRTTRPARVVAFVAGLLTVVLR